MAGLNLHAPSGEVTVSTSVKTVISLIAAANHRVKIKGVEIFFKGTVATDAPAKVEFGRFSSDGTGSSGTVHYNNEDDSETIQTTTKTGYTAEPTYTSVFKTWEVHPQTGLVVYFPPGEEIIVKGGNKAGIKVTAAATVICSVNLLIEE